MYMGEGVERVAAANTEKLYKKGTDEEVKGSAWISEGITKPLSTIQPTTLQAI